jgi:hypothetical protein
VYSGLFILASNIFAPCDVPLLTEEEHAMEQYFLLDL